MLLHVHISQTVEYVQTGWAVGYCESCNSFGVVKFEDMRRVTWVCFFRAGSEKIGEACHCDFCEREVTRVVPRHLEIGDWKRSTGVQALARRLGLEPLPAASANDDQRLWSLLSRVDWATHPRRVDITSGLVAELIVGAVGGGPLGYALFPRLFPQLDELGTVFAGVLSGFVVGALLGAVGWALWRQRTLPTIKLRAAYERYPFDCRKARELARDCRWQVQRAAARLADDVVLRRWPPPDRRVAAT
jgi:hypothetical protein